VLDELDSRQVRAEGCVAAHHEEAPVTWYEFLLFVHVSGAIIWIGGGFLFQVYGLIELRSGDAAVIARFAGNAGRIGEQLFTPTSVVVVLAGVGLMLNGSWPWGRLWVIFALVAFTASFLLGALVLGPTAKRIAAVGPETAEGQRLIRRVFALLRVDLLFLFAIVFAMIVKPTGDDTWAIIVVAAILLAGSAVFLRGLRETGVPETSPSATH
jgi:uncharacterized membrane protein